MEAVVRLAKVCLAAACTVVGCRSVSPTNKPIEACVQACTSRASRECSESECARGCEFVLDRLVEGEMDKVVGCVARAPRRCSDPVWAGCAARVGPHLDGGPPAPAGPAEDE